MPFVVAECDPQEISFFHYGRAFRVYDLRSAAIGSAHPGLTTGPGNRSTGYLRRVPERFTGSLLITNVATNAGLSGSPGLANSLDSQLIQTLCPKYSGGQIIVDGRTDFLRSLSSSHIPIRDVPMNTIRQMQFSPARCCGAMIHR